MAGLAVEPAIPLPVARAILAKAEAVSGVRIDATRSDFIRLRVGRRLRVLGLSDYESYLARLEADASGAEIRALVESLTTHTTSFFRESRQYDWLVQEGFDMLAGHGPITVWSAAASLGAELWSAGILLAERDAAARRNSAWRLIGTDISARILHRARAATYTEDELAGLTPERVARFFLRSRRMLDHDRRPLYRVVPALRNRARFCEANLQDLSNLPPFTADLIFLRNVLIYFDPAAQARVADAVTGRLRPGGVLLTGHAETLGPHPALEPIRPTVYRKR